MAYPCSRSSLCSRDDVTEKRPLSWMAPEEVGDSETWKRGRAVEYLPTHLAVDPVAGLNGDLRRNSDGRRACPAEQAFWHERPSDI